MKKLLTLIILLSSGLFADIQWQKDIPTAMKMAKEQNKIVMLYVEGRHCKWCRKMKRRTLSNSEVKKRLNSFILVKVFKENREAIKDLPQVRFVPTVFFLTPKKEIIQTVTGYFEVADFLSYINDVEQYKK